MASTPSSSPLQTLSAWHEVLISVSSFSALAKQCPALYNTLRERYGAETGEQTQERFTVYKQLIEGLYKQASNNNNEHSFKLDEPIVLIASPGRDRLMMGHVRHMNWHMTQTYYSIIIDMFCCLL